MNNRSLVTLCFLIASVSLFNPVANAGDDHEEAALARFAIEQSGIDAQAAIAKVSKDYPGLIYQYELDDEDDRLVHEVKVINLDDKRKYKVKIDVKTGEVVSEEKKIVWSWFKEDEDITMAKYLQASNFTLIAALELLEKSGMVEASALLQEAELENNQGVYYFELETYGAGGEKKWFIDIDSQRMIPVLKQ
ncbi:PepSY domain-containing protein [Oceanicoccus sp. KOV_DT_Chl]|uniref:PepSY domain-containing protein n=1 Tax=Oceanicoccus sp. KOV_DT_Chl TaxID=1904639 RepID=UPI000C7E69D5|nr:PepSY domain-containing protein [Oceanicoccus sp. KOV_DT_Chl]